ncbi:MAG: bifunctional serine/threonine protein kinase/MFS transporter, partial [Planctomycetota bacterium]
GTVTPTSDSPLQFGDYQIIEEIARGGMGVVYRAHDTRLNRVVAMKMILGGQFASERDVERFRHEAAAVARLDHANIVPVYDTGEHDGNHFFTMKLIEGGSLASTMPELTNDIRRGVDLLRQVAAAVHFAHQRGILHRDLKPANILLEQSSGKPFVTDLGLAKLITDDQAEAATLTQAGAVIGTPAYMSPEQATAQDDVTTATDIYALGAMLYELLTGNAPHQGPSAFEVLRKVAEEEVKPPRKHNSNVDRTLELICLKCLKREPSQRYSSAAALADDLSAWMLGESTSVRPPSVGESMVRALRTNLSSALGAACVGAAIGTLFSIVTVVNFCQNGIPFFPKSFTLFPSEAQPRFLLLVHQVAMATPWWIELLMTIASYVGLLFAGMLNYRIVRPQSPGQSFAVGAVCGLVMNIVVYFSLGFILLIVFAHNATSRDIYQLSDAALGTPEQQEKARTELLKRHPDIASHNSKWRASVFGQRVYVSGIAGVPAGILSGVVVSSILCILPSILGTTFAFRVFKEEKTRHAVFLYIELVFALVYLLFGVFFQVLVAIEPRTAEWVDPRWQTQVPGFLLAGLAIFAVYRRWDWRIRLLLFALCVAVRNAFLMG